MCTLFWLVISGLLLAAVAKRNVTTDVSHTHTHIHTHTHTLTQTQTHTHTHTPHTTHTLHTHTHKHTTHTHTPHTRTRTHTNIQNASRFVLAMRIDASIASAALQFTAQSGHNRGDYKQQHNFRELVSNRNYVILISTNMCHVVTGLRNLFSYLRLLPHRSVTNPSFLFIITRTIR